MSSPSPRPVLRVQPPGDAAFVHALAEGETVIGRDSLSALALDDTRVSRRHAVVVCTGGSATVADLASRNGTFLNGETVGTRPASLSPGDVLTIGDFTLVFDPGLGVEFAAAPVADAMREVLHKRPVDVILSGVVPATGGTREMSANDLRFELEKKTRVLGLFYELGRTLGAVFSLDDVYGKAMGLLMQVTPAARVVIFQQVEGAEMKQVASRMRGANQDELAAQPLRVSKTVFDNVAKQRVSVLLENTRGDASTAPASLLLQLTHSVMAAPIVGRKGLLGVIYVDQEDIRQTFSADDLDLLNAVAVQTGIALDTVRTHEALQREAKAREKYERFLPQQLVDDVMLDPHREIVPGGTRRTISVLFADLRGFTTLSEANPPEAVVGLLNRFFTLMSEVIFRHGGTLDKYIGDGVLALFGAPYATERDAVKAVRAAIDMQRAMQQFNLERAAAGQPEIGVGIGINTGPAIVGFIGSDTRLDYTAIGDTVNTAARLEQRAKAGQILISEHTMQAVDASVNYAVLEAVLVKGRTAKLQIAEVVWRRG
jgi:adenylate cyclase